MTVVVRERLVVTGIVQGVGFRPHLARLAEELGLAGRCHNDSVCVIAAVEGPAAAIAAFRRRAVDEAPPMARIASIEARGEQPTGEIGFHIVESGPADGVRTMVPPDAATCAACLAEMRDPHNRRFRHPFITCTHCGPRLTITLDLPYDRPVTTMAGFPLCEACAQEYADPHDRRFHAQPISCHACGPTLAFVEAAPRDTAVGAEDPLAAAQAALRDGRILAVKGIGGYHLVCDATSAAAVTRLRERKRRPHQPLAVMVPDLDTAQRIVEVPADAEPLLLGPERPIVLLPKATDSPVAAEVAPALGDLGVLLPYTPLHHLLLDGLPPLVVTSGNRSGEPLAYRDEDAFARLAGIADAFLTHDRPIAVPCDDSVIAWSDHGPVPIRRSRGFAPVAIDLGPSPTNPTVLAAGAEIKNTAALVRDGRAFLSAHLGDLASLETRQAYAAATDQMLRFHRSAPQLVVADLHPGYASRAWASEFADSLGAPLRLVQHHHAHLASLAAEHGRLDDEGPGLLGLVLDGTGYGCDGGIWGGELLRLGNGGTTAERLGHLAELPLPGGDAGVRNPVRVAAATLTRLGIDLDGTPLAEELGADERAVFGAARDWPLTSSAGRLFDVVSAMLGVRHRVTYEAQAAVELEALAARARRPVAPLPAAEVAGGVLDHAPWLAALTARVRAGEQPDRLARAFHEALADGLARLALDAATAGRIGTIGLSGGVFANRLLTGLLIERLETAEIEVLTHRLVPCGDGGLSLGQAAIGLRLAERKE